MVILIGGPSCVGKTTMAQHLMEKYHITYMSMDHVKMGIIRSKLDCGFTADDPEDKVMAHVWPVMKEIVKTNIENDQNIIIEGCYLPTDDVQKFGEEYQKFIVPFYLVFSEEYIQKHFEDGIIEHRSETEHKDVDDYMKSDYFKKAHAVQKDRCLKAGQKVFEVKEDYDRDLQEAYDWVDEMIRMKMPLRFNE